MSAPFMPEYMMPNTAITTQFPNGANQMGFNSAGASNYYPHSNYFNLPTTSTNTYSQQQYPPMASNLFYSNTSSWFQYYGKFFFIIKFSLILNNF